MQRYVLGKALLTFVLLGGAGLSFLLDWQANHLLNPLWHPHARYHAAILLFLFGGTAGVGTWLLWRPSREPQAAFTAATLLSLAYWTPFFYVPILLPVASYWAGIPGHQPQLAGFNFYPNLVVVGFFAALSILGWCLGPRLRSSSI